MKYILFFIAILFWINLLFTSNLLYSQTSINGVVIDNETQIPIANANVTLSAITLTDPKLESLLGQSVSDLKGNFVFNNITAGEYTISYFHEGYKSGSIKINTEKGKTLNLILKLNQSEITTGEINVSSTRYEAMLKDVPLPMEIISDDELNRKPYQTISDALGNKPGLSLTRDGIWATDISIRGLSKSNVVMNIDGNRVETANDLSARMSLIDINDVDRIEIIKGGVSSLYGTGAFGGVVNIFTKNGDFSNKFIYGGSLLGGYNSVNESPNIWTSVFASSQKFFAKISGSFKDAKNTMTPKGELPNSQFKDFNINANLGYKFLKNNELRVSYQKYKATDIGLPGGGSLFPMNAIVKYPVETREMFSGEYKLKNITLPLKEFSVKYFYQSILRDVVNNPGTVQLVKTNSGKIKQRVSVLSITPNARHYTNGLQFKADWLLGKNNYLITGVDIWMRALDSKRERNQKIENIDTTSGSVTNTIYKTIGEKPIPDADYRSIGAYIQDEFKLFKDKLKFNVGGRIDQIKITNSVTYQPVYDITNGVRNDNPSGKKIIWDSREADDVSWSANLGAIYSITKNYDLTFNISRSFRSPSLEERYQYIDLGSSVRVGNPDLSPEKGAFVDLGFRVWRDKFTFTGNIFYNYFEDLVTEISGTYENRPAFIKTNIGKSRLYGYDLDFMYNFFRSFVGYGSLSYVRGEDTENKANLPQIPPMNAKVGLKFSVYNYVNFDLNTTLYNKQENTAIGEMDTPGYAVFSAGLSSMPMKIKFMALQLFAGVENIFDKEYRNHLSSNRGLLTIEPGRNFYAKLKLDF